MQRRTTRPGILAVVILLVFSSQQARAQGEHSRRVAAEILVLRGDAIQLLSSPTMAANHSTGFNHRLSGGLAGLSLMLRLADQENGVPSVNIQQSVDKLRTALDANQLPDFIDTLTALITRYPLSTAYPLADHQSAKRNTFARQLHDENCAGCHDAPNQAVSRPAYNLFEQSRKTSTLEFTARMIVGVRGDRMTGIGNPLSEDQITALVIFYRSQTQ